MNIAVSTQANSSYTTKPNGQVLGKDDFLKIFVTQLKNQDPLEPLQDREFISQMAQFSSLEQAFNQNQLLQQFVDLQLRGNLIEKSNLIGKKVFWIEASGELKEGLVNAIVSKDGRLFAEIANDANEQIDVEAIIRVETNQE